MEEKNFGWCVCYCVCIFFFFFVEHNQLDLKIYFCHSLWIPLHILLPFPPAVGSTFGFFTKMRLNSLNDRTPKKKINNRLNWGVFSEASREQIFEARLAQTRSF